MTTHARNRESALQEEIESLRARLVEPEETIRAIRQGEVDAFVIYEESGERIYTLETAINALRRSEETFRVMAETVPDVLFITNADGECQHINQRFCELTGSSEDAALGWGWLEALHLEDQPKARQMWRDCRISGQPFESQFRYALAGGSFRWFMVRARPVHDAQGNIVKWCGCCSDIDAQKRAEQELAEHGAKLEQLVRQRTTDLEASHQRLRSSERMAALGTLSAGLGHDLGNLLLPVRLRLDSIQSRTDGLPQEVLEDVDAIRTCAEYLQRLARGLRLFALDPDGDALDHSTDLNEWWGDVEPFLKNALPRMIQLTHDIPAGLPPVKVARSALTQAVFNIVQNAGYALRDRRSGHVFVWAKSDAAGAGVQLGVTDDGPGMTDDVRRRCLEPFFTTKTSGLSTGLGLSLVQGIVQKAGGRIDVQSEPERGTTFVLTLPIGVDPNLRPQDRELNGPPPLAVVALADARLRAFVTSVLESLSIDVVEGGHSLADMRQVQIWVADAGEPAYRLGREFIDGNSNRHVLIFGKMPAGLQSHDFIELGESPKPTVIREAISHIAAKLDERRGAG